MYAFRWVSCAGSSQPRKCLVVTCKERQVGRSKVCVYAAGGPEKGPQAARALGGDVRDVGAAMCLEVGRRRHGRQDTGEASMLPNATLGVGSKNNRRAKTAKRTCMWYRRGQTARSVEHGCCPPMKGPCSAAGPGAGGRTGLSCTVCRAPLQGSCRAVRHHASVQGIALATGSSRGSQLSAAAYRGKRPARPAPPPAQPPSQLPPLGWRT